MSHVETPMFKINLDPYWRILMLSLAEELNQSHTFWALELLGPTCYCRLLTQKALPWQELHGRGLLAFNQRHEIRCYNGAQQQRELGCLQASAERRQLRLLCTSLSLHLIRINGSERLKDKMARAWVPGLCVDKESALYSCLWASCEQELNVYFELSYMSA